MFDKIFDFSLTRTTKQAVGFYIAHLVIVLIGAGILGFLSALIYPPSDKTAGFTEGYRIGNALVMVYVTIVSFVLLKKKNLLGNFKFILLALASIAASALGGAILGMIIPAVLTKRPVLGTPPSTPVINPPPTPPVAA